MIIMKVYKNEYVQKKIESEKRDILYTRARAHAHIRARACEILYTLIIIIIIDGLFIDSRLLRVITIL